MKIIMLGNVVEEQRWGRISTEVKYITQGYVFSFDHKNLEKDVWYRLGDGPFVKQDMFVKADEWFDDYKSPTQDELLAFEMTHSFSPSLLDAT